MSPTSLTEIGAWPQLSFADARPTYETIHLWTQIVGKIKLAKLPWINHSWHVTLAVTPTGLTTGNILGGGKDFEISFDFLQHRLRIATSVGEERTFELATLSVASCYQQTMDTLRAFDIDCVIDPTPSELENPTPFHLDLALGRYDPQHASRLHVALLRAHDVFTQFRGEFIGKCSPVHFFWGGFDLAVSRFSGEEAPLHPGGVPNLPDWVAQEAYSHEVCSCGFWPGSEAMPFAAFYAYIYPEPENFERSPVKPEAAYYDGKLREFILPYDAVQGSPDPAQSLLDFLHSTYRAAAELSHWDTNRLEAKSIGSGSARKPKFGRVRGQGEIPNA